MFGLYIVGGMVLAGAIVLVFMYHQESLKMTSSTTGEVVSADQREVREADERREETVLVCRYTVAGQAYTIERVLPGRQATRFPAGRPLSIRYNPGAPERSRIVGL